MLAPTVEELAGEYDGRIKFGKLNVDENRQTTQKFGISGIPSLLIFKNGQVVKKVVGVKPKKDLKTELDAQL
jgi:thioredoxin 1